MVDKQQQPHQHHIHIVEDDDKVASLLRGQLERFGYEVTRSDDWQHISDEIARLNPGLVLLDINLPYYDGFYWCRRIRQFSKAPIIFISARDGGMDQVMALESGGDDYVTKPFHAEVVIAKVGALLRRAYGDYETTSTTGAEMQSHDLESPLGSRPGTMLGTRNEPEPEPEPGWNPNPSATPNRSPGLSLDPSTHTSLSPHPNSSANHANPQGSPGQFTIGQLTLDLRRALVTVGNTTESLTRTELSLLGALVEADGAVVRRETLLELLWDDTQFVDDNTLTVNVARVRRKLADLGLSDVVLTVRGVGYRIDMNALEAAP